MSKQHKSPHHVLVVTDPTLEVVVRRAGRCPAHPKAQFPEPVPCADCAATIEYEEPPQVFKPTVVGRRPWWRRIFR